jgi:antitoxin component YwqK of YwqJK toxin-antitoxin module
MKIACTIFFTLNMIISSYSQDIIFVKDSIMDNYMKTGFSNKHFMPKGKEDKNNLRQGNWKDYEVINDFMYVSENGMPKQIFGYFLLYQEGKYIDGKREGIWKFYVLEDQTFKKYLQQELNYVKGEIVGDFKYYFPSGKIGVEGKYLSNNLEGEVTSYYENGKLYGKRLYDNGLRIGRHTYQYSNGKLKLEQNFINDTLNGLYQSFYPNGILQESFSYYKGETNGTYKYYYENGQLWIEKEYKNGLQLNIIGSYDNQGNQRDKGTIKDGNGTVKYYTEDGKVYSIQTFKDGIKIKEEDLLEDPFNK